MLTDKQSLLGQSLGPYKIVSLLGAGGMGEVYLAHDRRLGRKVALKLLPDSFSHDKIRMRRFWHEARAASALNHPNILTIYDIGEAEGRQFIASEYIEGETLRQRMNRTRIEIAEALDIAVQVASALREAHGAGIVHRDIKPENIMLRCGGLVKVLDFGLVKLTEKAIAQNSDPMVPTLIETDPNVVVGTAQYMSPEQARGLPVDARTDIWSLGVVLYEMVTRRAPFRGQTQADTILSVLQTDPPPLNQYESSASVELQRIVVKALSKDREQRFQTVGEMRLELESLAQELDSAAKLQRSSQTGVSHEARVTPIGSTQSMDKTSVERPARWTRNVAYLIDELKRHKKAVGLISLAIVVVIAGFSGYRIFSGGKTISSLAVLPFVNANADQEVEYLSDGITESVIHNLSLLPNVKVMSRNAVFRYKGKEMDAQIVGRELGVQAVLTGRIVRRGDNLLINVELVDAYDNSHIWGEQYNRNSADLLATQLEISRHVSDQLRLPLTGQRQQPIAKQFTQNHEAYQFYMKGRYYLERRSAEDIKRAVQYLQQAIELDPQYALAYAELANAYHYLGDYEPVSPRESKAAVMKALEIDDTLGEAHAQLADLLHIDDWDWSGAEREFKRAIQLNPNYGEAHHAYSHFLLERGRVAESLAESIRNLELDPFSTATNLHMGWHYLYSRQFDQAIAAELKTLVMDPNYARAYLYLAEAYQQKGMFNETVEAYLKHRMLDGATPEEIVALKDAYTSGGITGFWRKSLELKLEESKSKHIAPYDIAAHYARLGEKEQALEMLAKAYAEHSQAMVGLNLDFAFDNMRSDPRFKEFVRRVGLPD